jgi:isocitrate dehydrogenase kinase/phosphatase
MSYVPDRYYFAQVCSECRVEFGNSFCICLFKLTVVSGTELFIFTSTESLPDSHRAKEVAHDYLGSRMDWTETSARVAVVNDISWLAVFAEGAIIIFGQTTTSRQSHWLPLVAIVRIAGGR